MKSDRIALKRLGWIAAQGLILTMIGSSLVLFFTSSEETWNRLRNTVHWPLVPLLALPVLCSWTCNGLRFHLMCRCVGRPLSLRRCWAIAVSSEFGAAASPGGVGGTAIRLGLLKKSGVPVSLSSTLLAADLFIDFVFFALLMPFAFWALHRTIGLPGLLQAIRIGPVLWSIPVLAGLLVLLRRLARSLPERFVEKIRRRKTAVKKGLQESRTAARFIFRHHRTALLLNLVLCAVQFTSRYSLLPLAILLPGHAVDPLPLVLMQGLLYLLALAVVAPGGGGSVELLAALALPHFMPMEDVGIAVLLWRFFAYHFYLVAGGPVFLLSYRMIQRRRKHPASAGGHLVGVCAVGGGLRT